MLSDWRCQRKGKVQGDCTSNALGRLLFERPIFPEILETSIGHTALQGEKWRWRPAPLQCIPERFSRAPAMFLQPASTTPEPTHSPISRKFAYRMRSRPAAQLRHFRACSQRGASLPSAPGTAWIRPLPSSACLFAVHAAASSEPASQTAFATSVRCSFAWNRSRISIAPGQVPEWEIPDPRRSVADDDPARSALDGRRETGGATITHRKSRLLVALLRRPHHSQLAIVGLRRTVRLLALAALLLRLPGRNAGAVDADLHRRRRRTLRLDLLPLVGRDLDPKRLGGALHLLRAEPQSHPFSQQAARRRETRVRRRFAGHPQNRGRRRRAFHAGRGVARKNPAAAIPAASAGPLQFDAAGFRQKIF